MFGVVTQFANASAENKSDLLGSLGIDVQLLVLQTIAFLILLVILSKFVFPVLSKMLEKREKLIEESVQAARDAEKNASEAEEKTAQLMKDARKQADEMLTGAKTEASNIVDAAEKKSRERAEQIVADAEAEIKKDVAAAKKSLRAETLGLVAEATEKVVKKTVTAAVDKKVVADAVQEADA